MKAVVVTGVSTGIGRAVAVDLVAKGYRVFGSVRKREDAQALSAELGEAYVPLILDVTDERAVHAAAEAVEQAVGTEGLFGLVNNAGMAVAAPLMHADPDQFRYQLEVNTIAPLVVTQAFLPLLGASLPPRERPGRIINISSVAGRLVAPFNAQYAASKHALEALSDGLRRELMLYGIDVVVIEPGPIKTAIWDKLEDEDVERFRDTDYYPMLKRVLGDFLARGREGALPAEDIAALVYEGLTATLPKARYVALANKFSFWTLPRLLPDRWLDRLMAGRMGLKKGGVD